LSSAARTAGTAIQKLVLISSAKAAERDYPNRHKSLSLQSAQTAQAQDFMLAGQCFSGAKSRIRV
jgi:hypothetical protein